MLKNLTETQDTLIRLLPNLTGGEFLNYGESGVQSNPVHLRPLQVSTGVCSTYVVPGDWPESPDRWFAEDVPTTFPIRRQNNVEYLVDGAPTYEAMVEAMETATSPGHYIVILGWTLHTDFLLSDDGRRCPAARANLKKVLESRVAVGVKVRGLFWDNTVADGSFEQPSPVALHVGALNSLNKLRSAPGDISVIALLDQNTRRLGCHHQKIVLVYGTVGLIGFFGGIDFNPDRVPAPDVSGSGGKLHDVHARVVGDAAHDLMDIATRRWNYSIPETQTVPIFEQGPSWDRPVFARGRDIFDMTILQREFLKIKHPPQVPHRIVKIAQTIGNPTLAAEPKQTNGVWDSVRKAIRAARKFIYVEDQYFWSEEAAQELGDAAKRIEGHIIILTPSDDHIRGSGGVPCRHAALKRLKTVSGSCSHKILMFVPRNKYHFYIHAKMFVMDDELAIVGSANCNNRGYFYDSEINGAITDPSWSDETSSWRADWASLKLGFAHKFRMKLWAEHLHMAPEDLVDALASEVHWYAPSRVAEIAPYLIDDLSWENYQYDIHYRTGFPVDPKP